MRGRSLAMKSLLFSQLLKDWLIPRKLAEKPKRLIVADFSVKSILS